MQTKYIFLAFLILITLLSEAFAQTSPQVRRLPPSLERELKMRKGGKTRIIGFIDTLKAQNVIAQSIRDSSEEELDLANVKDSAIIVIDSSVSLTHKEWLDSMLAELPEYRMTPEGIRFQYPNNIIVETSRKIVPFDSTILSLMDPVSKENLPLYDVSPLPKPLVQTSFPKTSLGLGLGAPYIPYFEARSLVVDNERSALELNGKYKVTGADDPAIKQFWQIGAQGSFAFPNTSVPVGEQIPQLNVSAVTGVNKRMVISAIDSTQHSLSLTNFGGDFIVGSSSQLKLRTYAFLSFLSDDIGTGNFERSGEIGLSLLKDISNSPYQLSLTSAYKGAGSISTAFNTVTPSFLSTEIFLRQKENNPVAWEVGLSYVNGSDAGGNTSLLLPVASIRTQLSHTVEIGASFEPQTQLVGLKELLAANLFYSPAIASTSSSKDSLFRSDPRHVVSEPVHLSAFIRYFLSLADELHAELRYIERNNEPVFDEHSDSKGHTIFDAAPFNTRRLEVEAGGNLLFFTKDKLKASFLFRSASTRSDMRALPFEPTMQIQANYQFGNISEKFLPLIEFIHLARTDKSLSFINLDARYSINQQFQLKLRAENIFGAAGDFWSGYNEYPRSVLISGQYSF